MSECRKCGKPWQRWNIVTYASPFPWVGAPLTLGILAACPDLHDVDMEEYYRIGDYLVDSSVPEEDARHYLRYIGVM